MRPVKYLAFVAAAAVSLSAVPAFAPAAQAQTNIDSYAQFGLTNAVVYLPFNVSTAGTFDINTSGLNPIDPWLQLFTGWATTGAGLGTYLGQADDTAPAQAGWNVCSGAGNTCHAFYSSFLGVGSYTVAFSVAEFLEAEARAGFNSWGDFGGAYGDTDCYLDQDYSDCGYNVSLTSRDGIASTVPEPATMTLLATGLAGMAAARRKKRRS